MAETNENHDALYERLRQRIDRMPVGMPGTDTGEERRILQHLFTPREAGVALYLDIVPRTAESIRDRMERGASAPAPDQTEEILDALAARGAIMKTRRGGKKRYSYLQFVVGMFELQVDRMTPEFAADSFAYTNGAFALEMHRTGIPQLRAVPVNANAASPLAIEPYDDVRRLVRETPGQFGVMNCICKQRADLIGRRCTVTDIRETCITFPHATAIFRKIGANRDVTREEVFGILDRAEREGLVLQLGNSKRPMVACCCCGDCCEMLVSAKRFPDPARLFTTNYYASVDPARCTGCGACGKRCQMDAPALREGLAAVDRGRCIGCGLCVSTCPASAIGLMKKKAVTVPPVDNRALYRKIMMKKNGFLKTLAAGIRMMAGAKS